MSSSENIDYRFKVLYFIGIVLVVAGHCDNGGFSLLYEWFPPYSFHLGLFVFCSGYFYKYENERAIGQYIIKKIKRLIVPVYLWNIVYGLIVFLLSYKGFTIGMGISIDKFLIQPILSGHQFDYNLGGWFVIPLFMIEVINVLIRGLLDRMRISVNECVFFVMVLLCGCIGIWLAAKGINTGWWLVCDRVLYFFPFYTLGILYKQVIEPKDTISNGLYFLIIIMLQLSIILKEGDAPQYVPSWCEGFDANFILPFVVGFLGIAFWLRVARIITPLCVNSKIVNTVADNAFSIMIHQLFGFMLVKTVIACVYKLNMGCADFDLSRFKTEVFYIYLPNGIEQFRIVYLLVGIVFPIVLSQIIKVIKDWVSGRSVKSINYYSRVQ